MPGLRTPVLLALVLFLIPSAWAQQKDLTLEDYAQWERIGVNTLSPDGTWFAYQITPVEGDGSLRVKRVGDTDEHVFELGSNPRFSNDNAWLAFAIGVSEAERKKMEKSKTRVELSLGLMNLRTAEVDTVEHVQSAVFSDDGRYVAMRKYAPEGQNETGADLVVRHLSTGTHQGIGNVSEYAFSPEGSLLAVAIDATEKLGNGIQLLDLEASSLRVLDSAEKTFSDLTWRDDSFDLAYLREDVQVGEDYPDHVVVIHPRVVDGNEVYVFDAAGRDDFPAGYRVASEGGVRFSDDGSRVFFGLKERIVAEDEDDAADETEDSATEEEDADDAGDEETDDDRVTIAERDKDLDPPGVDIWHWNDPIVQPRQGVIANREKNFTYLSAWTMASDAFAKLADDDIRTVSLTGDQRHGVGYDQTPYQPALRETWNDVYVVDTESGAREQILERIESAWTSPDGDYVIYFRDNDWWSYSVAEGVHRNLTQDVDTQFNNFTAIY
ncbi:MAG: hypothetical protein HKN29_16790, partial [Rhodothermales bacterium]|nr:hypothetical protein [Rhodothermales bacterium]